MKELTVQDGGDKLKDLSREEGLGRRGGREKEKRRREGRELIHSL